MLCGLNKHISECWSTQTVKIWSISTLKDGLLCDASPSSWSAHGWLCTVLWIVISSSSQLSHRGDKNKLPSRLQHCLSKIIKCNVSLPFFCYWRIYSSERHSVFFEQFDSGFDDHNSVQNIHIHTVYCTQIYYKSVKWSITQISIPRWLHINKEGRSLLELK